VKPPSLVLGLVRRPRLAIAALLGLATWFALRPELAPASRLVIALDTAGLCFLILSAIMVYRTSAEATRAHAQMLDEGHIGMAIVPMGVAALSFAAVFLETRDAKTLPAEIVHLHLALAAGSIVIAWLVTHTLFGIHYAHLFYGDNDEGTSHRGGLEFPGDDDPDYWDFLYFAFVVGMTCQTSDVQVTGRPIRRLTLLHGVLAFFINTVVLAMVINIAASLL